VDIDQWRLGADVVGELLRSLDECRRDDASLIELEEHLRPLLAKVGEVLGDDDAPTDRSVELRRWLDQAEGLLVGELAKGEA
jgi:hypothetical protein